MTQGGRVHRTSLPVVVETITDGAVATGGAVIALALGAGLALWIGPLVGAQAVWLAFAPLALWVYWLRHRRAGRLVASDERELEASARRLRVAGEEHRASSATYGEGALRVRVARGLAVVSVLATVTEAREITDALGVPEEGVRTVRVWGPIGSIPVLGFACMTAGPALATFAALVLLGASHLAPAATVAFTGIALVSGAIGAVALAPRTLRITDDRIELRWLGRTHAHPLVALESIAIEGDAIALSIRGERPRRYPLIPVTSPGGPTLADGRREAARRAAGPIALATTRKIADVFE